MLLLGSIVLHRTVWSHKIYLYVFMAWTWVGPKGEVIVINFCFRRLQKFRRSSSNFSPLFVLLPYLLHFLSADSDSSALLVIQEEEKAEKEKADYFQKVFS